MAHLRVGGAQIARAARPSLLGQALAWLAITCAMALAGCSSAPIATPSPVAVHTADPNPSVATPSATPTLAGSPATGQSTLTLGVLDGAGFGLLIPETFMGSEARALLQRLVMSSLYRRDDQVRPVPDLAAEPCTISADSMTVTCRLRDARFHDGSPVTADDVVFSFETLAGAGDAVVRGRPVTATAVDAQTIRLTLEEPDATFFDEVLSYVPVASRALHEAAYEVVVDAASDLPSDAAQLLASIDERRHAAQESPAASAICSELLDELEALRASAPRLLPEELILDRLPQLYSFPPCEPVEKLTLMLGQAVSARDDPTVEALPAAYLLVAMHVPRIGSGPFRVAEHEPGVATTFVAHDAYHHGRPAIDRIVARVMDDEDEATEALRRGTVDLLRLSGGVADEARYEALRDEPGIRIASYPGSIFTALQFNVRPERLFHEVELRQALQLCLDKPALVGAATRGRGIPLNGPLLPVHWAYQPDLDAPDRDVAAARRLIESAGWVLGEDGVYARDGRRLATDVWVRAEETERVRFLELVAQRAKDCSIELTARPEAFNPLVVMVSNPPHSAPGRDEPFDLYFGAWSIGLEPQTALEPLFHSDAIPIEGVPDPGRLNYVGYSNPRFDELVEAARTSPDMRERARLYGELQKILAEDLPYLFGWATTVRSYFTTDLGSIDAPLNLESLFWDWRLEKLTLNRGGF